MNLRALVCCRCGGPLANPEVLPALIDCLYCGTVNSATQASTSESRDWTPWQDRMNAIVKFTDALVVALNEGRPPFDALRISSAAHLGAAGRADTIARIALALAQDFEREAGVSIVRDPVVLSRVAQAYLRALDELHTSENYELSLPFLTADASGPKHFQRRLTAKLLAELAAREPRLDAPPPPPPPPNSPTPAPPVKKKGWWPF